MSGRGVTNEHFPDWSIKRHRTSPRKEFAANGATLGLVARREDKLKELIAELPNPELHTAIVCDVTDRDR